MTQIPSFCISKTNTFWKVGCYALMIVLPGLQLLWYRCENARRDRLVAEQQHEIDPNERSGFSDKTDFERWETFRYAM